VLVSVALLAGGTVLAGVARRRRKS
jgi:hypothetical protein